MSREISEQDWIQYRQLKEFIKENENKKLGQRASLKLGEDGNVRAVITEFGTKKVLKESDGVPFPLCGCGGEGIFHEVPSVNHKGKDTQILCSICGRGTYPSDAGIAIRMWIAIMLGIELLWESEYRGIFSFQGGFD